MKNKDIILGIMVLIPMVAIGLASGLRCQVCWGINHLIYLPSVWWWIYATACVVSAVVLFAPLSQSLMDRLVDTSDRITFAPNPLPRIALALTAMIVFWLLRPVTHFLGDGYTQLALFGQGFQYAGRWTSPLAGWVIGYVQSLFGGYTWHTAELAFRTTSIVGGGVYVFASLNLARLLTDNAKHRLLTATALTCGGGIMLFCGYVEVYAMFWSTGMLFLWLTLRVLKANGSIVWPALAVALAIALHLQAIYLVPAMFVLIAVHYRISFGKRVKIVTSATVIMAAVVLWGVKWGFAWPSILMEVVDPGHGYALLSGKHLLDIAIEILLVVPLAPILLAIGRRGKPSGFGLTVLPAAVVALGFLLLIKPALGMARDWDLMSFPLILCVIVLVDRMREPSGRYLTRLALAAPIVSLTLATTFVGTNLYAESSENRFRSLIHRYDGFDDSGWAILSTYYVNTDRDSLAIEAAKEMERRGIRSKESSHVQAKLLREQGRYAEAERYYLDAVATGRYAPHIKNELGQMYMSQGRYRDAIRILREAHRDAPRLTSVVEGLGLAYFKMGASDTASMYVDTLMSGDPNSPGGHVLAMVIDISRGEIDSAKRHFEGYLEHGRGRSDYNRLREYYGYLLDR